MIDTLIQRHLSLRAGTLRADDRSVEAVVSSETPVPEWDDLRGEVIPRVLLAGGAKIPASRQIPLLDSHNRSGIENQVGSVRNLRVEAGQILGRLVFSSTAEEPWQLVREGHLTDVSVGFAVTTQTYVEAGASRTISGRTYQGPTNVATSWIPRETSIVSIGADSAAKILRSLHRTRLAPTRTICWRPCDDSSGDDSREAANQNTAARAVPNAGRARRTESAARQHRRRVGIVRQNDRRPSAGRKSLSPLAAWNSRRFTNSIKGEQQDGHRNRNGRTEENAR